MSLWSSPMQFHAFLQKHKVIGWQCETQGLRNVHMCLATFDLTESPLQRSYAVATVATFSSIPIAGRPHWAETGIWMLLEYREMTALPVFYCTLCFAWLLRNHLGKNLKSYSQFTYMYVWGAGGARAKGWPTEATAGRTSHSYESAHQKGKRVAWPATPSIRAGGLTGMVVLGPIWWLLCKHMQT